MISRRLRNVAILMAILALVVAACGPQATATPTPTEEVVATEEATAEAETATEEATEEAAATEEATEEATTEEATEEAAAEEATEEAAGEAATEEAVVEATEAAGEATEAAGEATEEAVVEATEAAGEATEEAVVEATEAAGEATEEAVVEVTEEPVPSVDDGAGFVFNYAEGFELQSGNGLYRLSSGDQLIVVVSPVAYGTVLGAVTLEEGASPLAFYLERTGYTVGEETDGVFAIELPRRNLVGTATAVDLGEGNTAVVLQLSTDAASLPDASVVIESLAYTPPPPPEEEAAVEEEAAATPLTIVGVSLNTEGLETLATAIVRAGLATTLNDEGSYTVFAPTDEAFAAALEALGLTADELLADTELLSSVLNYHVVEGAVASADLTDGQELTTLSGGVLTVHVADGAVTITDGQGNTYNVVTADIVASNGVVHVIDGVLMAAAE